MSKLIYIVYIVSIAALALTTFLPSDSAAQQDVVPAPPKFQEECTIRTTWPSQNIKIGADNCPAQGDKAKLETNQAVCCVFDTLVAVTTWVFFAVMVLVIFFIAVGAYYIMSAGGNVERVNLGRSFVIYAAIGALVGILARAIPGIAASILGISVR